MRSCMLFSPVEALIWWSTWFNFRLSARPFLGSIGKATPSPFCVLPKLARSASACYYLFLQCVFQHLGYLLSMASHPCLTWKFTWGIRSDLEGLFLFGYFRRFLRSLQSGQRIFLIASVITATLDRKSVAVIKCYHCDARSEERRSDK